MLGYTSTLKGSYEKIYSADGLVRMKVQAHAALTALTPYAIVCNEYGPITAALPSSGASIYVGVPEVAQDSGDMFEIVIGGPVDDVVTPSLSVSVGHGLTINTRAVADIGADFSGAAGEFAVCRTASTSSTTQDLNLVPEKILTI